MTATVLLVLLLAACGGTSADAEHADHDDAAVAGTADPALGTHGGRLLARDGVAVELALAEDDDPATYRAWLYRDGKPLPASAGRVEVALTRLGGRRERHLLAPQRDGSLRATTGVAEPHSFDVEVAATIAGKTVRWAYPSSEARTVIPARIAADSGIRVRAAGPGVIADEHEMQGLLTPVEGRTAHVAARFPGPIRSLRANVGDRVRAGQTLATIESNLSLTTYPVPAPIAGQVLARNATLGSVAAEGAALFEIADLSSLWVDLHVFGADAQHIVPGAPVTVTRMSDGVDVDTVLERVLPGTATASQSTVARATIANADGLWRPGAAVRARITVARRPVALAVPLTALQDMNDAPAVFVRIGDAYEARPVTLGERDATQVEVRAGLAPGDAVVIAQSYLVKADIEKSGASHEH